MFKSLLNIDKYWYLIGQVTVLDAMFFDLL